MQDNRLADWFTTETISPAQAAAGAWVLCPLPGVMAHPLAWVTVYQLAWERARAALARRAPASQAKLERWQKAWPN